MKKTELDQYLEIINHMLMKSAVKINKWRETFMLEVLLLYLIIPWRINFLQLGLYGRFGEQRYRQQFGRKFDWLSFNAGLAKSHLGNRVAIAFDPSYISKSGKCPLTWDVFGLVVQRGLNGVWKSPALVWLTLTFILVCTWKQFKRHLSKHWNKLNGH